MAEAREACKVRKCIQGSQCKLRRCIQGHDECARRSGEQELRSHARWQMCLRGDAQEKAANESCAAVQGNGAELPQPIDGAPLTCVCSAIAKTASHPTAHNRGAQHAPPLSTHMVQRLMLGAGLQRSVEAESLKEALEKGRAQKLSLESQLQELKEAFAPFDKNGAYEELLDIQTKIRQVRQSLEKSKDRETIEVGEEITELMKQKQELSLNGLTHANHSYPESNSNSNFTELEKAITLENLKLTVDSINKMNWCILTNFTSKNISYSVILSENLQIHIQFMLSCSNNNEIIVSKTNISFSVTEIEASPGDLEISKNFFNNVLNNEVYGILSDKKLENIKSVASIKALMLTISGHISQFRRANPNRFN